MLYKSLTNTRERVSWNRIVEHVTKFQGTDKEGILIIHEISNQDFNNESNSDETHYYYHYYYYYYYY